MTRWPNQNGDGRTQKEDWIKYYSSRAVEIKSRAQAEQVTLEVHHGGGSHGPTCRMMEQDDMDAAMRVEADATFTRADVNQDGELTMQELSDFIQAHPEEVRSVTERGHSAWGDLLGLSSYDTNGDGLIQRHEWVSYYVARSCEIRNRAEAQSVKAKALNDLRSNGDAMASAEESINQEGLLVY